MKYSWTLVLEHCMCPTLSDVICKPKLWSWAELQSLRNDSGQQQTAKGDAEKQSKWMKDKVRLIAEVSNRLIAKCSSFLY